MNGEEIRNKIDQAFFCNGGMFEDILKEMLEQMNGPGTMTEKICKNCEWRKDRECTNDGKIHEADSRTEIGQDILDEMEG